MARYEPNWAERMMEPVEFGGYVTNEEYERCRAAFAKAQSEVVRHVARIHALADALRIARGYVDDDTKPLHEADLARMGDRMDDVLMAQCDNWLEKRIKERDFPHDFDDVTWVMHDFVLWLRAEESQSDAAAKPK